MFLLIDFRFVFRIYVLLFVIVVEFFSGYRVGFKYLYIVILDRFSIFNMEI